MILEIRLSNFFSIKDEVVLDLQAGNAKSKKARLLKDNTFEFNDSTVLKTVALYGANASGKSNIIKAIRFCASMVFQSHQHNEDVIFNFKPFKFNGYPKKMSKFSIYFVSNDVEYEYRYSLNQLEIITEELYHYPNGRRAKVFIRDERLGPDKSKIYSFGTVIKKPMDVAENTSRKTLYISRASQMDRIIPKEIFNYFYTSFVLGYKGFNAPAMESLFSENKKLLLKALQIADSDIIDIKVRKEKSLGKRLNANFGDNTASISEVNEEVLFFTTFHKSHPGVEFDFNSEESDGTKLLFHIMLTLLDIIKHNKILLIDEIDSSLHSEIVEYMVSLFHAGEKAQLIFTTHNTNLLNLDKLRKDQIYFVNKDRKGVTELYSLFDFKDFRETMDTGKAYLQGRFDAIPYVNDSISNLKNMLNEQE